MQGCAAGFERTNCKSIACEIALIHRGSSPIKLAIMDFAAIGRVSPTLAWWNNIAVCIQRDHQAIAVVTSEDQVRDTCHTLSLDIGIINRM